jgi:hypothetical protein
MKALNKIKSYLPSGPDLRAGTFYEKDRHVYKTCTEKVKSHRDLKLGNFYGIIPDGTDEWRFGELVLHDEKVWLRFNDCDFCQVFFNESSNPIARKSLTSENCW